MCECECVCVCVCVFAYMGRGVMTHVQEKNTSINSQVSIAKFVVFICQFNSNHVTFMHLVMLGIYQ